MYDQQRSVLIVTRGEVTTRHHISEMAPLKSDVQRRDILPNLALQIAREIRK